MVEDLLQSMDLVDHLDAHYLLLFEVHITLGFKSEVFTFILVYDLAQILYKG
jgi:hypothetical protein